MPGKPGTNGAKGERGVNDLVPGQPGNPGYPGRGFPGRPGARVSSFSNDDFITWTTTKNITSIHPISMFSNQDDDYTTKLTS